MWGEGAYAGHLKRHKDVKGLIVPVNMIVILIMIIVRMSLVLDL